MSVVVTSNTTAFLHAWGLGEQPKPAKLLAPRVDNFGWEGNRIANVEFGPIDIRGGVYGWTVTLDDPAGVSFPVINGNPWLSGNDTTAWVCKDQGTALEDRSIWYIWNALEQPWEFSAVWLQLPNGSRQDPLPVY